jgi:diaminohydroxyphosphoribosylaminopyrimidine deaminase/5-amino-6-(5-phosphoribosylamino)uracil reductase
VAQTLDGKIADSQGTSKWITARNARKKVHGLRSTYDAVLVGAGTVRNDNPRLTVRLVKGRNPLRVILEGRSAIRSNARVFSKNARTLVFTASKRRPVKYGSNVEFVEVRNSVNGLLPLKKILKDLGERGIASVLVEGGAMIFSEFLAQGLVDRIYCFVAPCVMGKGLDAFHHIANRTIKRTIDLESVAASMAGQDLLVQALVRKR